jgi:hypothetical protein
VLGFLMADGKDNRWRNLGIIVVVLIVLVLAFFYLPSLIPFQTTEKLTLDEGYDEIRTIFESNGVDIEEVRLVNILSVNEFGEVVQSVSNEELKVVIGDLDKFIAEADSKYDDSEELKDVASLLKGSIEYTINKSVLLDEFNLINLESFDCSNKNKLADLNRVVENNFYELADLVIYSLEFNEEYGYTENDEIILVDLDFQAAETELFMDYLTYISDSCGVV